MQHDLWYDLLRQQQVVRFQHRDDERFRKEAYDSKKSIRCLIWLRQHIDAGINISERDRIR
jgi:hypothetical protein